jgi:DNA mismatch repair protein MutH
MYSKNPPQSKQELMERARQLDGLKVGELARRLGVRLVQDPVRSKGLLGELLELVLGASAGTMDIPDFPELGVELKTIPLDQLGHVRESTFVCAIDLSAVHQEEWESSRVRRKLACVLWMPIEAGGAACAKPLAARRLGTPRLWQPTKDQEATLRADWSNLIGRIALGGIEEISGHQGEVLQIRPKARHGSVQVPVRGPEGEHLTTVPRGFYLRARFTEQILWTNDP